MIISKDGMETKVLILPYKESSIDKKMFVQAPEIGPVLVSSVENYEECLVRITLPDGNSSVVLKAEQIITAVKKCIL